MTALSPAIPRTGKRHDRLPSTVRLGLASSVLEIKAFFRRWERVGFTFAMPVVLLIIFGTIFTGKVTGTSVNYREYFATGIIAVGIATTTFVNLGISIVLERDDGTLKRLAGTPMPKAAYFIGKAVSGLVVTVLETAVLLAIGTAFLGLSLPHTPLRWFTFGWLFVLSVATFSLLGVAVSGIAGSAQSAAVVFQFPYLVLSFISGVYFVFGSLPKVLQDIAAVFPLKWLCQGLRSVFLPDSLQRIEPAHSWQRGEIALVLAVWLVASLVVCARTFRWQGRDEAR
ncbi:MAG TPA: ABC transporter permease [Streptosporangiaceae bacterium]|jgi:ABC-2 type transport system permease protein